MKHKTGFGMLGLFSIILAAAPLSAQTAKPGVPVSPRRAALGGLHAADLGGFDSLFANPAGLAEAEGVWSYSRVALNAQGPIFDMANMALGGTDVMDNLTSLLDEKGRLYTAMDLATPIAFGYAGGGLGIGVFNRTYVVINAPSVSSTYLTLGEEFLLTGGYAHRFHLGGGHTLDAGVAVKGFLRNEFAWSGALTDVDTALADLFGGVPYTLAAGIGLDAGVLWRFGDFALGLAARDLLTPYMATTYSSYNAFKADPSASKTDTESDLLPIDLSLGFRWSPRWGFLVRNGNELTLLLDYRNIVGLFRVLDRNPLLEFNLGAELVLLEILSLRAGIQDALPAAGFGLDLQVFDLSLAMYGKELGLEPGSRPVFNLILALDFVY